MSPKTSVIYTSTIEREIVERIAAAKLRLRFDRVVRWLVDDLKAELTELMPEGEALLFTITAPIKLPAKTATALKSLARGEISGHEFRGNIHGNQVHIRRLVGISTPMPRVIAFVHNPESDASVILKLAELRMLDRTW